MKKYTVCLLTAVLLVGGLGFRYLSAADQEINNLPRIQKKLKTGFSNGGWAADRYKNMETLDAHRSIVIADIEGPGIIRHIHTTRHHRRPISTRGIVLLIYFDGAAEAAVLCPLGDFFGDGCNGKSMDFSNPLIECAPGSYNTYIPMPFKTGARVVLRNDTDIDLDNYSYVEWEPLETWDPGLGYFHATYRRRAFQLTDETKKTFLHLKGTGHLLGRQFSVATDEPWFKKFHFVMEGNNEVDIDGEERRLDYLGSEDSFTFSWGFQNTFAGLHAGMPLVKTGDLNLLSIFRFHDHMPIRFNRELVWSINWNYEFRKVPDWPEPIRLRSREGGCWVDYASVFYWYQDSPAGFTHHPIEPLERRILDLSKSSLKGTETK
jgi:D-arabinan exo alpha-(1,3)/(1,5)-arabinofuranosidase (non-reducing end)